VDREIPAALKRLSESEDKCLKVAQTLLDHGDSLANAKQDLEALIEALPEDSESRPAMMAIAVKCDEISQSINIEASIGDLVGQRLLKITDFLESSLTIFQELIEEHGGAEPKKATRAKPGYGKAEDGESRRGPKAYRDHDGPKKPRKASKSEEDRELTDHDDPDNGEAEAVMARPAAKAAKAAKEKKKAHEGEELFGPDDEALSQDEVNELVNKLFK
jgi:hypothetical protein